MQPVIIKVGELFSKYDFLGSRGSGEQLRKEIDSLLGQENQKVLLDFKGIDRISHSFADEVFGLLSVKFGLDYIKTHLALQNAQENIKVMANFVVKERMKR